MLVVAALALLVVGILWWYFNEEENPLDKLPGPSKLPFIGNAHQLIKMKPEIILDIFVEYTKLYGDRYTFKVLGDRSIHISAPADVEVVLSNSKNITKSMVYQFLSGWLGNGLLLSTGAHWQARRKILTPTFHFNILKNFATVIEEKSQDLVRMLKEKKGAYVNVMPVISDYTLFAICETAMGTKLDGVQSAATIEYKNAIMNIGYILLSRITKFWVWSDFVFTKTPTGKKFVTILEIVRSFADKVIMDRKAHRAENKIEEITGDENFGSKKRLAMLDLLLEAEAKGQIDMEGIRDEVNTFMFEGHDTTATAMTFGLMLLANDDEAQASILEEVQNVLGDSNRSPSLSDLAEMKYLEAVIKEILRLYPSVPFIERKIVEDFKLGHLLVKKDTTVTLHIYELHRRPDIFPEPDAFKPERFLGNEARHPYAYVPFSAGPRNCIGQRFAMQEMKTTFCEVVRNFKLVPQVKGARPKLMSDMVLRPVDPILIKFIPRT